MKKDENIILVLGSEGEGVSRVINKIANHRVMIPPQLSKDHIGVYPFNMVDSLNVGVSAGVLLYHIRHLVKKVWLHPWDKISYRFIELELINLIKGELRS